MTQSIDKLRCGDFTGEEFADLLAVSSRLERPEGQLLLVEGETTDHILLIVEGHVKVEFAGVARLLDVRGPGEVIGDNAVLLGSPRTANVTTITSASALLIPGRAWLDFLHRHPAATYKQLVRARRDLLFANRRAITDRYGAERRLAIALTELAERQVWDEVDGFTVIRLKQEELARFTGLKRDSVVKVFRSFKENGLIGVQRGAITLINRGHLGRIAQGELSVTS